MPTERRNFLAVCASHLLAGTALAAFIPFVPFYLEELGVVHAAARNVWTGLILGTAPLLAAITGPFWGALADRVGRKAMLIRCLASIAVFVGLMGAAREPWQLWALSAGQGLFAGFIAAGNTLVSVSTPDARQGRSLGGVQGALLAGLAIGPFLGGVIGDHAGHATVFITSGALAAAALVVVAFVAREPDAPRPPHGPIVAAVRRDVRAALGRARMPATLGALVCFRASIAMMYLALPIHLAELGGYPPEYRSTVTGLLFVAVVAPIPLLAPWWGRRADRVGARPTFVACALAGAALYVPYAFADGAASLTAARVVHGVFLAGIMPAAYAVVGQLAPRADRGATFGVTQSALQAAMAVGPFLGGAITRVADVRWTFAAAAVLLVGSAILMRPRA